MQTAGLELNVFACERKTQLYELREHLGGSREPSVPQCKWKGFSFWMCHYHFSAFKGLFSQAHKDGFSFRKIEKM